MNKKHLSLRAHVAFVCLMLTLMCQRIEPRELSIKLKQSSPDMQEILYRDIAKNDNKIKFIFVNEDRGKNYLCHVSYNKSFGLKYDEPSKQGTLLWAKYDNNQQIETFRFKYELGAFYKFEASSDNLPYDVTVTFENENDSNIKHTKIIRIVERLPRSISPESITIEPKTIAFPELTAGKRTESYPKPIIINWKGTDQLEEGEEILLHIKADDKNGRLKIFQDNGPDQQEPKRLNKIEISLQHENQEKTINSVISIPQQIATATPNSANIIFELVSDDPSIKIDDERASKKEIKRIPVTWSFKPAKRTDPTYFILAILLLFFLLICYLLYQNSRKRDAQRGAAKRKIISKSHSDRHDDYEEISDIYQDVDKSQSLIKSDEDLQGGFYSNDRRRDGTIPFVTSKTDIPQQAEKKAKGFFYQFHPNPIKLEVTAFRSDAPTSAYYDGGEPLTLEAQTKFPIILRLIPDKDIIVTKSKNDISDTGNVEKSIKAGDSRITFYVFVKPGMVNEQRKGLITAVFLEAKKKWFSSKYRIGTKIRSETIQCEWLTKAEDEIEQEIDSRYDGEEDGQQHVHRDHRDIRYPELKLDYNTLSFIRRLETGELTPRDLDEWEQKARDFDRLQKKYKELMEDFQRNKKGDTAVIPERLKQIEDAWKEEQEYLRLQKEKLNQERDELDKTIEDQRLTINHLSQKLKEQDQIISKKNQIIDEKDQRISIMERKLGQPVSGEKEVAEPEAEVIEEHVDQQKLDELLSRPRQLNEFLAKMAENQIFREEVNTIKNTESALSNIIRNAALNPLQDQAEFEKQYNHFLENRMISILEYLQGKKDQNSHQIFSELCRLAGITPIAPSEGAAYDPGKHEGISFIPTSPDKRRRILNVVQNGLEMNGKVYRKAKVEVGQ